jgi:hypothetical protein
MIDFTGYRNLMLYLLMDTVRLAQKGDNYANDWLNSVGVDNTICLAGMEGQLKPQTVRNLVKKGRIKKRLECLVLDKEFMEDK